MVWLWASSLNVAALIDTSDGTGGQLLEGANVTQTVTPQVGAGNVVPNTLDPVTATGITAQDKVYDNTTTVTLNIGTPVLHGVFFGDGVGLNTTNATGTFADQNAGTGKAVSIAGLTLTGTTAANYVLIAPTTAATITPRSITVAAAAETKTYGDADPVLTYQVTSGSLVGGDNFTGSLMHQAGETVANRPFAIIQGTLALGSNYTLSYVGADFIISLAPVVPQPDSLIAGMTGTGYPQVFTTTGGILTGYTFTVTAGACLRDWS